MKLILASASPRRRELMEQAGADFVVEVPQVDERVKDFVSAEDTPEFLASLKAEAVFSRHRGENVSVIGSDTIVMLDGRIFGKPHDEEDAFRMLRALSGRTHEVLTGVAIISAGPKVRKVSFTDTVSVSFYELTDDEIREYIATGEPMDKAGAYGAQGRGALLIREVRGDFYSVVGLPVARVMRELKALKKS